MILKLNKFTGGVLLLIILFCACVFLVNKYVPIKRCKKSFKELFHERSVEDFTDNPHLNLFLSEEKSFTDVPVAPCNATTVVSSYLNI